MNSKIYDYFSIEKQLNDFMSQLYTDKLCRYEDIREEFLKWLEQRTYDMEKPLKICGYTAERIHEMAPFMDGAGVYNFMVTLREKPVEAQKYIANSFLVK